MRGSAAEWNISERKQRESKSQLTNRDNLDMTRQGLMFGVHMNEKLLFCP